MAAETVTPRRFGVAFITGVVLAVPVIIAVAALTMSSVFAGEMMTDDEMDREGRVEAKWDYVDEENSVDMESDE